LHIKFQDLFYRYLNMMTSSKNEGDNFFVKSSFLFSVDKILNDTKQLHQLTIYENPSVMKTHNHVIETHNPLMETLYDLWKPFLKNKELSFMETIFEKQGMFE
jgi:hypothetical protein